jgi:hypothetical protein
MPLLCSVLLASFTASVSIAEAEDRGAWFKSLTQPGTGMSCCDMADCRRTDADWHGGQWWADVKGRWTPVPPEKELNKSSIDGEAYICTSPSGNIYCFVKPNLAM